MAVIIPATLALAEGARGFYFASYMGLKIPESAVASSMHFSNGAERNFAGALGFRISRHWRMEAEASYRKDEIAQTPLADHVKSFAGLVNVYYDFDAPGKLKPFIGGGAGYISKLSEDSSGGDKLVWQLGGGVNYALSPALSFNGAYRYVDEGMDAASDGYGGHELHIGVTYALPFKPAPKPRQNQ